MRTRLIACAIALTALLVQVANVDAATSAFQVSVPGAAQVDLSTALTLRLPSSVSAVDGRVLFDKNALEFVGVAPVGGGTALSPVDVPGGVAFGAYGLHAKNGSTVLQLVVAPLAAGSVQVHVVIDSTATSAGGRF